MLVSCSNRQICLLVSFSFHYDEHDGWGYLFFFPLFFHCFYAPKKGSTQDGDKA